jgi:hypothetical protein
VPKRLKRRRLTSCPSRSNATEEDEAKLTSRRLATPAGVGKTSNQTMRKRGNGAQPDESVSVGEHCGAKAPAKSSTINDRPATPDG